LNSIKRPLFGLKWTRCGVFITIRDVKSGCGGPLTTRVEKARAFWFGRREHKNLDKLMELLEPLKIGKVYTDGNYAYYERFSSEVLTVTKKNRQKIKRKHLSLRTWCVPLVRKGIRFSKTEQLHKIVVGLIINVWFLGRVYLIQ
jgi:insertion element IS1 protein InsB